MFWKLEYVIRITKNDTMTPIANLNVHKLLVSNYALCVIGYYIELFEDALEVNDIDNFHYSEIKLSIEKL